MKKNRGFKVIGALLVILIFTIGVKTYSFIKEKNNYINTIESNWGISIPEGYSRVYSSDSGGSLLGDGERYNVFKYEGDSLNSIKVNWEEKKSFFVENSISAISKSLEVKEEYKINFEEEYKYFYNKKEDSSEIYMVFLKKSNLLYIIEDIM
ncbi:hypothetical protein [Clostridium sp.]|uniref:hypothetical protein n=1 Tax=Clostridium sp. TaxID=1506 RepID=UPI003F405329